MFGTAVSARATSTAPGALDYPAGLVFGGTAPESRTILPLHSDAKRIPHFLLGTFHG
jgi:hypothetical protein